MQETESQPNPDIQALLKEHGIDVTPERIAVAELLLAKPVHTTPRALHEIIKERFPSITLDAVALVLADFEKKGLLKTCRINGATVFDSNLQKHHHAACMQCGKVIDLPPLEIPGVPEQIKDWRINTAIRVWHGVCPDCLDIE
jgi:Fur family peroxide stress response transcriptional regulator